MAGVGKRLETMLHDDLRLDDMVREVEGLVFCWEGWWGVTLDCGDGGGEGALQQNKTS